MNTDILTGVLLLILVSLVLWACYMLKNSEDQTPECPICHKKMIYSREVSYLPLSDVQKLEWVCPDINCRTTVITKDSEFFSMDIPTEDNYIKIMDHIRSRSNTNDPIKLKWR